MTTPDDSSAQTSTPRSPRVLARRASLALSTVLLALGLSGCLDLPSRIDVSVRNYCVGPNYTVSVYINNSYQGNVTTIRTFTNVRSGVVQLRAVGTGYGGSTYLHERLSWTSFTWTLCGSAGTLSGDGNEFAGFDEAPEGPGSEKVDID